MHIFEAITAIIEQLPTWLNVIRELLSNLGTL